MRLFYYNLNNAISFPGTKGSGGAWRCACCGADRFASAQV